MARGTKTGGRGFQKGNPGRPVGAKDKTKRLTPSIKKLIAEVVTESPDAIKDAVLQGITGPHAHHYIRLAAEYVDGKPTQPLEVSGDPNRPVTVKFGGRYKPTNGSE